jgi:ComF family protein
MWTEMPSRCQVCGRWPARPVCAPCHARFAHAEPRCPTCALRLVAGVAVKPCGQCLRHPMPLQKCWAVVDYAYPWHTVVVRFKFQQQPAWARTMAELALQRPDIAQALHTADGVLPVPLTASRLAERGYNQSWELVKALQPRCPLANVLLRLGDAPHQTGQGRHARQQHMRDAFAVDPAHLPQLAGQHLLLVDDVMTTGATLSAAADTLLRAGAASVSGLCFARTPADD